MVSSRFLAACSSVLLQTLVAGSPISPTIVPRYFQDSPITRRDLTADQVQRELGPLVSDGTLIFGPESSEYTNATSRWITFVRPDVRVVVEPAAESDISLIVKYCNDNSIEFLTRNRGHGGTMSLNSFQGLQINMNQLQGIEIQDDGETALLQGGAYAGPVIETLWGQGYVTSTGAATCVGLTGLGLGGGHGRLESLYGLVADGLVHLNVVLADGSEVDVNETSHEDLWWAMKGAGHNFGIVTSYRAKIYPRPANTWHYHHYVWTQDKLETVFEELNNLHTSDNGTTPPLMSFETGAITMDTSISATEAVLAWSFIYNGPAEDAEEILKPFNSIGAASEDMGDVLYPQIAEIEGTGESSPTCSSGPLVLSTQMLLRYNVTTERQLYDQFNQKAAQYPQLGSTARLSHEGYANAAVKAVPYDSTAYPHRDENHIVYLLTAVPEGSDLLEPAETWAKEAWDLWNAGEPQREPQVYVNYAIGHSYESVQSVYGYEPWRLERLVDLKAKYDPHNRFRFFVPIVAEPR